VKMTMKFALSFAAAAAFSVLPVYAQHTGGHGGGPPSGGGASMGSSHSSASTHGKSENSGSANSNSTGHSSSGKKTPGELLTQNTKLSSKLQSLLSPGTDLQAAAQGFKNLGQFVAAVHVSHNLGIPFDQLKAKMIGPPSESLGKAIHELKHDADSKTESTKATDQAKQDLKGSGKPS
jgi:hypothetical protein